MTRRRPAAPLPGIRAWFDGDCPRCDRPILRDESRIVAQRGVWLHCHCANGADE